VQIGVTVASDQLMFGPDEIRRFAVACQDSGYDYVTVLDHVVGADTTTRPDWSGFYGHENAFREPLTLLAFLAGAAPGLGASTSVLILPQRQTVLVAKQVAELDLLTAGRLRLGVGIGWNDVEYEALGIPFGGRAARYEEQIAVLRQLWTRPSVDVDGRYHRIDRAGILPLPVQRPVPIWMGGGTARPVLERIGRLGDGWIVMGNFQRPDDETRAALKVIHEAAERAGRDPAALGLEGRVQLVGGRPHERMRREADAWRELGASHLSLHGLPAHRPVAEYIELVHAGYALLA
jgi:probable F420-dependent oxidoreductase